jgi:hypothetical protein
MSESFLHYLWEFQYFTKIDLQTTDGERVVVFHPGHRNTHAGPDFQNARILIGDMEWVGTVEIHINASGWWEHKHDVDLAYENVVLHVVWKSDRPVKRSDGTMLPTLELKNRVDESLLLSYKRLINSPTDIPCYASFNDIAELTKISMLDKALFHRLETKAASVTNLLQRNNNDWEETCYQLLAKNFGFKVNAEPFLQLAQGLPYRVIMKQADQLIQVEAMLFGQAGFLEGKADTDDYHTLLRREYTLLSRKFNLQPTQLNKSQWKFLRLRPANFATVRLAQFAALLQGRKNLFSQLIGIDSFKTLREIFSVLQSEYWQSHYRFGKPVEEAVPALGDASIENIAINTVAPLLVAYGKAKDENGFIDQAVTILQQIHAESNKITRQWVAMGVPIKTAFDSQALIELYNNFCLRRRCLDCNIGASLLKPEK